MLRIRSLVTSVLLLIPVFLFSQTEDTSSYRLKYFNKTELGVFFGIGSFKARVFNNVEQKAKNDEIVVSLQTVNGVRYNNRWALGLSVGVEKWRDGWFWPIYGYLGYNFKKKDNTFYINAYLGYSIGKRDSTAYYREARGGFGMIIGIGYRMKVSKNLRFGYEVFYRYQALKSSYWTDYQKSDTARVITTGPTDMKFGMNFAGFKILVDLP